MSKIIKNNKTCHDLINSLNVSDEIKETLYRIESVAVSNNDRLKTSVKDLFISSPSCKELSKIAKCYERIITTNKVYPIRGSKTYLELAYPAYAKYEDYMEFFASPRLVAATQDKYTGVFLISFEQWKSANEFIRDMAFDKLIKFIEDNKTNISFVFHVIPEFQNSEILYKELSKHTVSNPCYIEHSFPDMEHAIEFVEIQLKESGIAFTGAGKREMKKLVENKINISSNGYRGYSTLEKLVSNLQFELCASIGKSTTRDIKKQIVIDKEELKMIAGNIDIPDENETYHRKLGFN
ncbi:MAG: hypothetical protein IJA34_10950 [Lachnospiraceae bacterium]|nr:hypothetical protein [Lachnospiraceae bacterium]